MNARYNWTLASLVALVAIGALPQPAFASDKPAKPSASPSESQDQLAAMRRLLEQQAELIKKLTDRIEKLEKERGIAPPTVPQKPGEEPPIPTAVIPGEKPGEVPAPTPGTPTAGPSQPGRATLAPDIAVIGNNFGRFLSVHGDPDRNRLQLGEIEIAMQQPVFPGVKFFAQIAGDAGAGFGLSAEEAFVRFEQIGHLPIAGLLGQKRLEFGKINPVHPHARPYVDQPAVISNLLGPDGLSGNGASVNYLMPVKNLFANLQVGLFRTDPAEEGMVTNPNQVQGLASLPRFAGRNRATGAPDVFYPAGLGVTNNFPMARLWTSKEMGRGREIELGASHGFGKADVGDNINLTGLDLTYRLFPGTFKRLMLQSEVFWHHRNDSIGGTGGHTRSGHYALLTWRPDQYYEYGLRYDNSRLPWPLEGRDTSWSLIWSNMMTEQFILRLQAKFGDRTHDVFLPGKRGFSELYLQLLWGAGSHTHPLQ